MDKKKKSQLVRLGGCQGGETRGLFCRRDGENSETEVHQV